MSLTGVGEPEPVSFVEELYVGVSPGSIADTNGVSDGEDDAEEPHEDDGDEDGEEFEDLDPGDAQLVVGDGGQGQGDVPHVLGADGHGDNRPEPRMS